MRLVTRTLLLVLCAVLLDGACGTNPRHVAPIDDPRATVPTSSAATARAALLATAEAATEIARARTIAAAALGQFELSYYWVTDSRDFTGPRGTPLYDKQCEVIATVSSGFARALVREGTGRLRDGRTVNVAGTCDCPTSRCYAVVGNRESWGIGVGNRSLQPFRSVAVDPRVVEVGSSLYIAELDGVVMPGDPPWGDFVHDGCVTAADRGGGVRGAEIDLFSGQRRYYYSLDRALRASEVTVYDGHVHGCVD